MSGIGDKNLLQEAATGGKSPTRKGIVETRSLGSLAVSVVGLGCNNFGLRLDQAATDVVSAPRSTRRQFFDTADVYWRHSE